MILLTVIWPLRTKLTHPGALFGLYLISHWGARFAVEFIRLNPRHAGLSAAQWFSIAMVALGTVLLTSSFAETHRRTSTA